MLLLHASVHLSFKRLLVCVLMCSLLAYGPVPVSATPITPGYGQAVQGEDDWLLVLAAIIGAVAAVGGLIVAIRNSPSRPPAAEADVVVQADETVGGDHSTSNPANAVRFVRGSKGSTAFGDLTVENLGAGRWVGSTDTSSGSAAPGGSSSGTLTGKVDGRVVVSAPLPANDALAQQVPTLATLTFLPSFAVDGLSLSSLGGELSADLDLGVTPSISPSYHWGFTTTLGSGGLTISERRGLFSDTDLVILGSAIVSMTPPPAVFMVGIEEPLDYAGGLRFSAAEATPATPVPEPSSVVLLLSGLSVLLLRRRLGIRGDAAPRRNESRWCSRSSIWSR